MSSINTGYCQIMSPVGHSTGDCEFKLTDTKTDRELAHIIATEVVGDIVDNAMDIIQKKSTGKIGDIITDSNEFDSIIESMEKIQIVDEEKGKKKRLGDQLESTNEIIADERKIRHQPVEKKSRLTDLVKNSKQLLSKYILNENIRHDNPEDDHKEKVIRVFEMDNQEEDNAIQSANVQLEANHLPEDVQEDFEDDNLDDIQLEKGSNGDTPENIKKTMTFPIAGTSSTKSFCNRYKTLKLTASELKKKKWNIGSKLMNIIKKNKSKKEDQGEEEDNEAKAVQ
ncbi:unnamed protein product [Brassicogethes aeneus]|uniref:Uncharacterized protein n=1 Tax=Brassicogethes aeneus TaxID=1431903 RepID=A0A9P0AZY7_BRAAE|nr:unnamed protein product [Brassicogethes aeneus]